MEQPPNPAGQRRRPPAAKNAPPVGAGYLVSSMRPNMLRILIIARYAWALPATLAGLLLSLIAFALGAKGRLVEGAVEIAGGRIDACVLVFPRHCRFGAITFGHIIIGVDHQTLAHHRLHEHVHVRQYERWGVLFFPLYLGSSLLQIARGRDPYLSNAFEREAFANSASCELRPDPAVNRTPIGDAPSADVSSAPVTSSRWASVRQCCR